MQFPIFPTKCATRVFRGRDPFKDDPDEAKPTDGEIASQTFVDCTVLAIPGYFLGSLRFHEQFHFSVCPRLFITFYLLPRVRFRIADAHFCGDECATPK